MHFNVLLQQLYANMLLADPTKMGTFLMDPTTKGCSTAILLRTTASKQLSLEFELSRAQDRPLNPTT